jgi:SAM-dependent methyltransferase
VGRVSDPEHFDYAFSVEDELFDMIYPPEIRDLSLRHWTPVAVARRAADFLVGEPETRVLDLGCGPGKFCIVGALTTAGHFTGVEQREELVNLARAAVQQERISNAEIVHANVTDIDFLAYDAFYLFNPFEENLFKRGKIDSSVEFSETLYEQYTGHVAAQLTRAPLGTRVVTYAGLCEEVPFCYECQKSSFGGVLKLWQKTMDRVTRAAEREARANRNRWRFLFEIRAAFDGSEAVGRINPDIMDFGSSLLSVGKIEGVPRSRRLRSH